MIASVRYSFLLLSMMVFTALAAASPPQAQPGRAAPAHVNTPQIFSGPLPVFEFHSGFWTNLHHFLYQQARLKKAAEIPFQTPGGTSTGEQPVKMEGLSGAEQTAWNFALVYYTRNVADKDLLFNGDMVNYKNQLGQVETCVDLTGRSRPDCDAGVPVEIARALETAAPVYRAHWWLEHDRANRVWIRAMSPLVQKMGVDMARDLAAVYQVNWPPQKIRVDVTAYAGWAGAYTTLDPVDVTVSSIDPRDQGLSGFEILFHEASHALAEFVRDAIVRECRARGKPIPRDLWHALLFYTTGEIVKRTLSTHDVAAKSVSDREASSETSATSTGSQTSATGDTLAVNGQQSGQLSKRKIKPADTLYTPYAFREGLYTRGWGDYLKLLEKFWQPYLDGKIEFDVAIARMTSAL